MNIEKMLKTCKIADVVHFVKKNKNIFETFFPLSIQPGLQAWHTVFYITSGLLFLEFIVFTIFGTSEEQPWNTPKGDGDYEMAAPVYH
jgi:hypothetical protein